MRRLDGSQGDIHERRRNRLLWQRTAAHMRDYITYIGNTLQLVHKGDDNTSLHSPLAADETLYTRQPLQQGDDNTSPHSPLVVDETLCMRQPRRPGEGNTIQGFALTLKEHNPHLRHKAAIYRRNP
jgi:hypothetical protein